MKKLFIFLCIFFLTNCSPDRNKIEEAQKILTEAEATKKEALEIQSQTEQLKEAYEKTRAETEMLKTRAEMILKKADEIRKEANEAKNNAELLKESLISQESPESLDVKEGNEDIPLPYLDETKKNSIKTH